MIGVDTKVIVRLLVETAWVLEEFYSYTRTQIATAIDGLLVTAQLKASNAKAVNLALQRYRSGNADFADRLLGVRNTLAGCECTATLDRKASKLAEFRLIAAGA